MAASTRLLGLASLLAACSAAPDPTPAPAATPPVVPPPPAPTPVAPPAPASPEPAQPITEPPARSDPLAATLRTIAPLLVALDRHEAAVHDDPDDRTATRERRRVVAELERLQQIARQQARADADATPRTAREFARVLAELAPTAGGRLQPLIHPELGLFVVHNVSGSVPHVDRITAWPHGDHDYSSRLDEERVLAALARAPRWRARPRTTVDDAGCESTSDHVTRASDTALESWAIVLGIDWGSVAAQYRLGPWDYARERFLGLADDLTRADYEHMQRAALAISHSAFVADHRLDFGSIAGRWYLLAIDVLDDACG